MKLTQLQIGIYFGNAIYSSEERNYPCFMRHFLSARSHFSHELYSRELSSENM